MKRVMGHRSVLFSAAFVSSLALGACTSSSNNDGPAGGAVSGALDTHCNGKDPQPTSEASCHPAETGDTGGDTGDAGADAAADSGASGDAGEPTGGDDAGGENGGSDFGATLYNSEGDDDDCKYHVKWTSTPVRKDQEVTFTLNLTRKADNQPGTKADPYVEVFLNDTHPAPNTHSTSTETSPGTYTIGPVKLDAAGQWTVRFHVYGSCSDEAEDSPHGHAAFYVQVP